MIGLLGRLVLSMAVVFGLMVVAAKVVRNRNFGGMRRNGPATRIDILARQSLGKSASVAVVMAAGKPLILGVTDSSVTILGEADAAALEQPEVPQHQSNESPRAQWTAPLGGANPGLTWKAWIEQLRDRTVRR